MPILGYGDLKDTAAHALWDLDEMKRVQLADGRNFDEMLAEIQSALNIVNADFANDPYYAGLMSVQDMPEIEAASDRGASDFIKEITDHSKLDPTKGATTGWSVPLKNWGGAIGWTMLGLRQRTSSQLAADVRTAINGIKQAYQQRALRRYFLATAETVGATAGASVPFCDGGTADANYIPPAYDGETFDATHDHFLRLDGISMTNVNALIDHLREHGHMGPYVLTVADADKASWTALDGFYKPKWDAVDFMQNADPRAMFADNETFIGAIEAADGVAFVRATSRVPTGYYGAHKAYGKLDPRNPLRMRIDPKFGFGFQIVPGSWVNAPHLLAVVMAQYDFGIGERTNGVCCENDAAGDYASPTIS